MLPAVLAGFVLALLAPAISRLARGAAGWLLAALPLGLAVFFAGQLPAVAAGEIVRSVYPWAEPLGVALSFRLDGLSLLFALLICGVGTLVLIYAGGYLAGHAQLGRFYLLLLFFMASMLGLVLADNLLALFVFWELTSISSYLLIGFDHQRPQAREAAWQALLVTGGGGLALLAGFVLLGQAVGSFELSEILKRGSLDHDLPAFAPIVLLVLLGAFTKSSQFPFHFWLPGAMEAPTPVSAYLHSATMVKAGVYLLARLSPVLGGSDLWLYAVAGGGGLTMLVGGWMALQASDLKRVLAYSTVSALGTLVMLVGLGSELAIQAAVAFLLAHAMYKGALFLVAGALDHETGTRDVDRLGGLLRAMPVTALAAGMAALSMAAVPPLFGFIAKELLLTATLNAPLAGVVTAATVGASAAFVAVALLAGARPFLGKPRELPKHPHEAPIALWLGPLMLAGSGLLLGLWPTSPAEGLLSAAATAALGKSAQLHLSLWHGVTTELLLSGITLAAGMALFAARNRSNTSSTRQRVHLVGPMHSLALCAGTPQGAYRLALAALAAIAARQTRLLQSGSLRAYLWIVLLTMAALTGGTMLGYAIVPRGDLGLAPRFYEIGLMVLIALSALATVVIPSRLAAIAALGVVGYGVAILFVVFGAPDVAMTQFLVETLTVVLFVLVFYHLPESTRVSAPAARLRDGIIAVAVGTVMALLALVCVETPRSSEVSQFYLHNSVAEAHGHNVVNVILVDFRALDTLGEITVLAIAGIGVYVLLKLRSPQRPNPGEAA